ncbi:MAG: diaminopimelate epimerase [Pseudomonadota bacterium]|jgi:diaminopimelate epimerase
MKFYRYHALGNDYLVVRASECKAPLTPALSRRICHRNFGIGSDGILVHEDCEPSVAFRLRIINPDGSEAEKSGNGLRIFARYLWDSKLVADKPFTVDTAGGRVTCLVSQQGRVVTVDMGRVSFRSEYIPVQGQPREVMGEEISINGTAVRFCAATVGNPHCVVLNIPSTEESARAFGPLLETHPLFPNRTNVQFLEVIDRATISIQIWERGAGYTLASGSSSSAAAAVAHKLGLVDDRITVRMPGGTIRIDIGPDFSIRMEGPVTRVATIELDPEAVEDLKP